MTIRRDHQQRAMIVAAATVAAVAVWGGSIRLAAAATDRTALRLALGAFRGPESARIRDAVEDQLVDRYILLPEALVTDSAHRSGLPLKTERAFAEVGKDLNVAAFITATVWRNDGWRVEMTVRQGETGRPLGQFDWSDSRLDKLTSRLGQTLLKRLQALLGPRYLARTGGVGGDAGAGAADRADPQRPPRSRVAVASAPPDEEQADHKQRSEKSEMIERTATQDEVPPVRSTFEVRLGGRVFNRTFAYADNVSRLPGYQVAGAFAVDAEVALHPFALHAVTRDSALAAVGITGAIVFAPTFESSAGSAGDRAQTQIHGYELGTRVRTTFGAFEVFPRISYLVDSFVVQLGAQSPDVTYRSARAGVMARFTASDQLTMFGSTDYLHVTSAGALTAEDRFSRATVRGIDITLGAGYRVTEAVDIQLVTGFRRYAFDMQARPTDSVIVGGASDQYLSLTLGLAYRPLLGGS
jgi:hypothetical protein